MTFVNTFGKGVPWEENLSKRSLALHNNLVPCCSNLLVKRFGCFTTTNIKKDNRKGDHEDNHKDKHKGVNEDKHKYKHKDNHEYQKKMINIY